MDNHVHLLVSATVAGRVSRALRQAGQTYVQSFNQRHGRVGTLWQGRFKQARGRQATRAAAAGDRCEVG